MLTRRERAISNLVEDVDYIEILTKWRNREIDWEKCDRQMRDMEEAEEVAIRQRENDPECMDDRKEALERKRFAGGWGNTEESA